MTTYYAKATGGSDAANGLTLGAAKTLPGAIAAAGNGDIIMMDNGVYAGFVLTDKPGITFQAINIVVPQVMPGWSQAHPARGTRHVSIRGCWLRNSPNVVFRDIKFVVDLWIDTTDGTHKDRSGAWVAEAAAAAGRVWADGAGGNHIVNWNATSHKPKFYYCEWFMGYGATHEEFDSTRSDYPEMESGTYATSVHNVTGRGDTPKSWWKNPTDLDVGTDTRAYNTIANGPHGAAALAGSGSSAEGAEFYACYFHDLTYGISAQINNGRTVVQQCWFSRLYKDFISTASNPWAAPDAQIYIRGNIFEQAFGYAFDSGNPHSDVFQHYSGMDDSTPATPAKLRGWVIERNFSLQRPDDRAGAQQYFMQGELRKGNPLDFVNYTGTLIRDNMSVQMGSDKGLLLAYAEDADVERNMFVSAPGFVGDTATAVIRLARNGYTNKAGRSRVRDNITEGLNVTDWVESIGNVTTGKRYAGLAYSNLLSGTFPLATSREIDWYTSMQRKAPYTAKGPKYTTLEALTLSAFTLSDIEPYVGFAPLQDVSPSSTVYSEVSLIRGPVGGVVTVSVGTGRFRILDAAGTVVNDWRSAALTNVAIGNYLQLEPVVPTLFNDDTTQVVTLTHATLGSFQTSLSVQTQTDINFPTVRLGDGVSLNYTGPIGANGTKLFLAIRFAMTAMPTGSSSYLFGNTNGQRNIRVRMVASGILRISMYDSTGATIGSVDSGALTLGRKYVLIVSVDTATGGSGFTAKIWDATVGGSSHLAFGTPTLTLDAVFGWADTTGAGALRSINSGGAGGVPDIDFVFLKIGEYLDANSPDTLYKLSASKIGHKGKGVFGVEPEIYVAGNAADYASPINLGTAGKFVTTGTAVSQVAKPWPPQLPIVVESQTEAPYYVDEPVELLVYTRGFNRAFNLLPESDKAGTWSADPIAVAEGSNGVVFTFTPTEAGTHTLTFANSIDYEAPAPVVLVARNPNGGTIQPGTTARLTKAQALNLKIVTDNANPATGLGPIKLKWNRLEHNVGLLDSVNINVDIVAPPTVVLKTASLAQTGVNSLVGSELDSVPEGNDVTVTLAANSPPIDYPE